jgi:hypothetical protein
MSHDVRNDPTVVDDDPAAIRTRARHFTWADEPKTARNAAQFAERLAPRRHRG